MPRTMIKPQPSIGYALADAVVRTGEPPRLALNIPYETPIPSCLDELAELIDELITDGEQLPTAEWPQSLTNQLAWQRSRARAVEEVAPLLDDIVEMLNRAGYFVTVRCSCDGPFSTQLRIEPL